jgi:hypothetical protein
LVGDEGSVSEWMMSGDEREERSERLVRARLVNKGARFYVSNNTNFVDSPISTYL